MSADNLREAIETRMAHCPMLSLEEYIRDPAPTPSLSASIAHLLLTRSAKHAQLAHPRLNPAWQPDATEQTDVGSIAHALLLDRDESRVVVIDASDWRTRAAKDQRDAARAEGKLPILTDRYGEVVHMVLAARQAIADAPEIAAAFADGRPEQTLLWQEQGTWCRCRPDWMTHDTRLLIDYKTTAASAEPDRWARGMLLDMGYDLQAALGLRAVRALFRPRDASFVFMVQETDPPYAVSFVGLSPEWEAFAAQKLRHALALWRHCVETDRWPSYPSRVCWAEPPAWAVTQFVARVPVLGSTADTVEAL